METDGLIGEFWFYCVVFDNDIFHVQTSVLEASENTEFAVAVISTRLGKGFVSSGEIWGLVNLFSLK